MGAEQLTFELTFPSDLAGARHAQDFLDEVLQELAYTERDIFAIKVSFEEALVNAIRHGNQLDLNKRVFIASTATAERFDVRITDEGLGFTPDPPEPLDPLDPHFSERPSGRGLLLMRLFMTEVQFHGCGNVVAMTKIPETAAS